MGRGGGGRGKGRRGNRGGEEEGRGGVEQDGGNGGSVLDVVRKVLRPTSAAEGVGVETAPIPEVKRVQPAGQDEAKVELEQQIEIMGQQMQQMQQRVRELEGGKEENAVVVQIDVEKCSGCGSCVEVCPNDAIELVEGRAVIAAEACAGCGVCVDECPNEALALNG
jgi:NAD-dependent dihydropyrimidine dehydrogenase PreA subunit